MDRATAKRRIEACLAIYRDAHANQNEREAAWERATFMAEKYGFKIQPKQQAKPQHYTSNASWSEPIRWTAWTKKHPTKLHIHDLRKYLLAKRYACYTKSLYENEDTIVIQADISKEQMNKLYKIIEKATHQHTAACEIYCNEHYYGISRKTNRQLFSVVFNVYCEYRANSFNMTGMKIAIDNTCHSLAEFEYSQLSWYESIYNELEEVLKNGK